MPGARFNQSTSLFRYCSFRSERNTRNNRGEDQPGPTDSNMTIIWPALIDQRWSIIFAFERKLELLLPPMPASQHPNKIPAKDHSYKQQHASLFPSLHSPSGEREGTLPIQTLWNVGIRGRFGAWFICFVVCRRPGIPCSSKRHFHGELGALIFQADQVSIICMSIIIHYFPYSLLNNSTGYRISSTWLHVALSSLHRLASSIFGASSVCRALMHGHTLTSFGEASIASIWFEGWKSRVPNMINQRGGKVKSCAAIASLPLSHRLRLLTIRILRPRRIKFLTPAGLLTSTMTRSMLSLLEPLQMLRPKPMVVQGPATITHQEPTSPAAISRPTIIFSHNFTSHCLLKTSWVNIIMLSQDMSNRQTSQASASMMIISRLNCHKSLISKRELNVMMIWTPSCLGMKHRMIRRVYNTALYANNLAGCVHGTWIVASSNFINFTSAH